MLDNNSNDINELIKKLDNKLVSSNICLNLPSDDIDLNLDIILDFPKNKVNDKKHTIDIKNNEINLEINDNKNDNKLKSKKESLKNLSNEKKKDKIDNNNNDILSDNQNFNDNKSLNSYLNGNKTNNKNEITEVQEEEINSKNEKNDNKIEEKGNEGENEKEKEKEDEKEDKKENEKEKEDKKEKEEEENRIIIEEELRREKEDKEREKEEDERRKNEEEKRKKREMERKEIEKERKKKEETEKEEEKNEKEDKKINKGEEKEEGKEEKKSENSIYIQSESSIKPIEKKKKSKIFMSLSEEQKNDYLSIMNDITNLKSEDNNIKDIDIEKYPTIILDFNQKEETLDDIIPNFKNIIKQNENEIEKRKHNFISHNYFEWIIEASPLLELIPECKISHVDLLTKIYNEEGLHNIPEINDDYGELIFENEIISENNSPIGNVEDLKSAYSEKNDILFLIKSKKEKRFGGYAHE